jgi:hypothetical protein
MFSSYIVIFLFLAKIQKDKPAMQALGTDNSFWGQNALL